MSMRPRSRLDALVADRVDSRREIVTTLASRAVDELRRMGLDALLIGSVASRRIHEHSDIDILVRGPVTASDRHTAEKAVGHVLSTSRIPFDLLFACDMTDDQARAFERGRN